MGWTGALTIDAAVGRQATRAASVRGNDVGRGVPIASTRRSSRCVLVWIAVLPVVAAAITGTGWAGFVRRAAIPRSCRGVGDPAGAVVGHSLLVRDSHRGSDGNDRRQHRRVRVVVDAGAQLAGSRARCSSQSGAGPMRNSAGRRRTLLAPSWLWIAYVLPIGARRVADHLPAQAPPGRAVDRDGHARLAFVAKGLNAPFARVNAFFYVHVPGMCLAARADEQGRCG